MGLPYAEKNDIWALGCITYELLTLRRPFDGQNLHSVVLKICNGNTPELPEKNTTKMKVLVRGMLQKSQEKRVGMVELIGNPFVRKSVETVLREHPLISESEDRPASQLDPSMFRLRSAAERKLSRIEDNTRAFHRYCVVMLRALASSSSEGVAGSSSLKPRESVADLKIGPIDEIAPEVIVSTFKVYGGAMLSRMRLHWDEAGLWKDGYLIEDEIEVSLKNTNHSIEPEIYTEIRH